MEGNSPKGSTNHQLGRVVGSLEGLIKAVDALSLRFEDHLKDHKQTWYWVIPTLISLATLAMLVFHNTGK